MHTGNVLIDVVMYLPALPERGGDVLATGSRMAVGGGLNSMLSAVRQGLPVTYAGMHGVGPFGELARRRMTELGIEIAQHQFDRADTGFSVAMVEPGGERTFATSAGAEAHLSSADLDRIDLRQGDIVYVSGYSLAFACNGPSLRDWLPTLPSSATVVVDPGPLVAEIEESVLAAALGRADWWTCNDREARLLTGRSAAAAAVLLSERTGRRGVVVRAGAAGAVLATPGSAPVEILGLPATEVVDTNGAGDIHTGAMIAALAAGLDPIRAIYRANVAAALSVSRHGPDSAPSAAEVDAAIAKAVAATRELQGPESE
ncbi:PfkB family carbohydrate kinase [Mycobacterium sp. 3519A]|uniref:PfkB family carbohydrate kinase n=1 Tax=Mycobacterium sp. 3519A TaxID=2057184 RepID=UPI001F2D993A|nr:PfkB family carbohydrate kinase [Mycobacterium sp. 3519A]